MSKKKKVPFGGLTVALLSASVLLLAGSTVGSNTVPINKENLPKINLEVY